MENQQQPSNKIALNYGLILGFVSILVSVVTYVMGAHYERDWKMGVLSFVIMIVIIIFGIKKFKELNNGFLSLGQGLKTGLGIALIGGIISIAYTLIFINFIEPDFLQKTLELAEQKLLDDPNLSEEQIEQAIEMQKKFSGPGMIAAFGLLWTLFLGFVISLVGSLAMQKKENPY